MSGAERIRGAVLAALDTVEDPCSVFNGTHLSLPDLGMVDRVEVDDDGRVLVRLFLDDPTCIFFFEISRLVKEAVAPIAGVTAVDFDIKADEIWTEQRMRPAARRRLARLRDERRATGAPLPMAGHGALPIAGHGQGRARR